MAVCLQGAQWLKCFAVLLWYLLGHNLCVMCQHSGACWQAGVRHEDRHGRLRFLAACNVLSGSRASHSAVITLAWAGVCCLCEVSALSCKVQAGGLGEFKPGSSAQ